MGQRITVAKTPKDTFEAYSGNGVWVGDHHLPEKYVTELGYYHKYFHDVMNAADKAGDMGENQYEYSLFTPEKWQAMREYLLAGPASDEHQGERTAQVIADVDRFFAELDATKDVLLFHWE